jgi:preprotein translocase subunit SecE
MDEVITIAAAVIIFLLVIMFIFFVKDKGLGNHDH